jgi:hypothetical protein
MPHDAAVVASSRCATVVHLVATRTWAYPLPGCPVRRLAINGVAAAHASLPHHLHARVPLAALAVAIVRALASRVPPKRGRARAPTYPPPSLPSRPADPAHQIRQG